MARPRHVLTNVEIAESEALFQALMPILERYTKDPLSWRMGCSPYETIAHVLRILSNHYAAEKKKLNADIQEELRDV